MLVDSSYICFVELFTPKLFYRELFRGRGLKLIEEKVKPAFKKIHDYYVDVSKSLKSIL